MKNKKRQDIRVLSLYKQHYFDCYDKNALQCKYSCLGYYDGIELSEKIHEGRNLFEKLTQSPISTIWSGVGMCTEKLKGKYSMQNIGIFRCRDLNNDAAYDFWNAKYENAPYFSVGFLQLQDSSQYMSVGTELETSIALSQTEDDTFVKCIVYYTLDNADAIVLIRSNSLCRINSSMHEITGNSGISYTHFIMGVAQEYLNASSTGVLENWNGMNCHIEDKISSINLNIVTAGNREIISQIKGLLDKQNQDVRFGLQGLSDSIYSYMAGHENLIVQIPNTNTRSLLGMMVKKGFATHGNPLYGNGIYNITTELCIEEKEIEDLEPLECRDSGEIPSLWCENLIKKYKQEFEKAYECGYESMVSMYRALLQTLNTLMQYEGFSMSNHIFYLLWPSFYMFDIQLEKTLCQSQISPRELDELKQACCSFISSVNSVLYHTIHTDQVFLMIPGATGTSYSIPVKLCLMYLGIADCLIEVLNDKTFKYTCMLTPELEGRPGTTLIRMGEANPDDRLIRFIASQRSLYRPRHFLIILAHEIAHYVGTEIRHRKYRQSMIVKSVSCFVAEAFLPSLENEIGFPLELKEFLQKLKEKICMSCIRYLDTRLEQCNIARKDHSEYLSTIIEEKLYEFLIDKREGVEAVIDSACDEYFKNVVGQSLFSASKSIDRLKDKLERRKKILLTSRDLRDFLYDIVAIYKEVFSDITAFSVLQCDYKTYVETFDVSEGRNLTESDICSYQQNVRSSIIRDLFRDKNEIITEDEDLINDVTQSVYSDSSCMEWPNGLFNIRYTYVWFQRLLYQYAEKCKESVEKQINEPIYANQLKKIRSLYRLFSKGDKTCDQIYSEINGHIVQYLKKVEEDYRNR